MPIVFAAVVPHNPLLVGSIAKDHHRLSAQTRAALTETMAEMYARQVETVVLLTPHGQVIKESVVLSVADRLVGKLSDFGDPRVVVQAPGAVAFAHRSKEVFEDAEIPVQLQTFASLDYGCVVPMTFMPTPIPHILPIHIGNQSSASLIRFGQSLYHACHLRSERVAILASCDFVRRAQSDSTGRPVALERTVGQVISTVDLSLASQLPIEPEVCGVPPLIALTAALSPLKTSGTVRSFEVVTRIGLLNGTYRIDA